MSYDISGTLRCSMRRVVVHLSRGEAAILKLTTLRSSGSPPETRVFWTCFTKLLYALSVLYYQQLMFWITQHTGGAIELGTLGVNVMREGSRL
jgi:hypothetical protein